MAPPESYYNRKVMKKFDGVWYEGVVDGHDVDGGVVFMHVTYSDGDEEEYSEKELAPLLKAAEKHGLHHRFGEEEGANDGGNDGGGGAGSSPGVGGRKRSRPAAGSYKDPGENDIGDVSPPKKRQQQKKRATAATATAKTPPPSSSKKQQRQQSTTPKSSAKTSLSPAAGAGAGAGAGGAKRLKSPSKIGALPRLQPVSNWACTINPPENKTATAEEAAAAAAAATSNSNANPNAAANAAGVRVLRVLLPSPLDYLTRHHKDCKCKLCKANMSKGKIKGGGRKAHKEAAAVAKAADDKGKDPGGGEEEEEEEEEGGGGGGGCGALDSGTPWDDFELGSAEDKKWEKEERELPNVVTEGARWAYTAAAKAAKNGEGPAPPNADGLKRDLKWRRLLRYEERTMGAVVAPASRVVDPIAVHLPRVHGVEYGPDKRTLRAKKYNPDAHNSAERRFHHCLEFYNAEREKCVVEEAQRKAASGGKRTDGKAMSARPDLKANTNCKEKGMYLQGLDARGSPKNLCGALMGIPVGTKFDSRVEACVTGVHSHWLSGISTTKLPKAKLGNNKYTKEALITTAISMSGGYEDDMDASDRCPYTGAGANDLLHTRMQFADQSLLENTSNRAMASSCDLGLPIRVMRGSPDKDSYTGKCYTYDGMYMVEDYNFVVGRSGYYVVRFMLHRLAGQPPVTSATVHFGNHMGQSLPAKQRAEDRPGFIMADISLGLEAVPVCVVNTFDTRSPYWAPPPEPIRLTRVASGGGASSPSPSSPSSFPSASSSATVEGVTAALEAAAAKNGGVVKKEFLVYLPCGGNIRSSAVPAPAPHVPSAQELRLLNGYTLQDPRQGPYNDKGCLHNFGSLVYEGEPGLSTGSTQLGLRHRLEVFRTQGKGWGVRSWDHIKAGEFVCEFTGEMLTHAESEARGAHENDEDWEGAGEYDEYMFNLGISHAATLRQLLDREYTDEQEREWREHGRPTPTPEQIRSMLAHAGLREEDAGEQFELDGLRAGSLARYINSSDQPNLFCQTVLAGHVDPRQGRICLFALQNIPALTELTYDYGTDYRTKLLGDEYLERLHRGSR